VRLFFALWPDDDARAHIAKAALRFAWPSMRGPYRKRIITRRWHCRRSLDASLAVLQQIGRAQRAAACTIRFDAYDYWRIRKW